MLTDKPITALLKKTGVELCVKRGSETVTVFRAYLQPLRYKNKIYLRGIATELGYDSLKKYLLISPVEINLTDIDGTELGLFFGNMHLSIDHTETVYFGSKPYYNWSIVSKEE